MFVEHVVETPMWLQAMVEDLTECVTPHAFIGPLGYCFLEPVAPDETWQVAVYPTPNTVRGQGPLDGATIVSGFDLDVGAVMARFHDVGELVWRTPAKYNANLDGPEIILRGRYTSKQVLLRFFHLPPPGEAPAYALDPATSRATALPV